MDIKILDINNKEKEIIKLKIEKTLNEKSEQGIYLLNNYINTRNRSATSNTLTRSEVSGGGAKPYRQKGTGNARRGTNRSPLRRGGGVVFGPKPKTVGNKVNKKQISTAIKQILQKKQKDIAVIDDKKAFKSKDGLNFLNKLDKNITKENKKVLIITNNFDNENLEKAFRNIENCIVDDIKQITPVDYLSSDIILFTNESITELQKRIG